MPDILDDIGTVLRDYEVSGDAMRCTPERVICDGGLPLWPERWNVLRHGTYSVTITMDTEPFRHSVAAAAHALNACAEAMLPAFQEFGRTLRKAFGVLENRNFHEAMLPRRHRRRCRVCNPYGNPRPQRGHYKPGPKAARIRRRR